MDGWNKRKCEGVLNEIDTIDEIAYEIRNCVRGCNSGCTTYAELGEYLCSLAAELKAYAELLADEEED